MAMIDTRPTIQDIMHYGGDTLYIKVTAPAELASTMKQWDAQVKAVRESEVVDSTFVITLPLVAGDPAYLMLPSAEVTRLVEGSPVITLRSPDGITRAVKQYKGVYDCQLSNMGTDPVRTIVQGSLTIEQDVTRLP